MEFCTGCGAELESEANFCVECGATVENKTQAGRIDEPLLILQPVFVKKLSYLRSIPLVIFGGMFLSFFLGPIVTGIVGFILSFFIGDFGYGIGILVYIAMLCIGIPTFSSGMPSVPMR